jgi:hypothetical protein
VSRYAITLKDLDTGEVKDFEYDPGYFPGWDSQDEAVRQEVEEGNMSCDCNRVDYFYPDGVPEGRVFNCNTSHLNLQKIVNLDTGEEIALLMSEYIK